MFLCFTENCFAGNFFNIKSIKNQLVRDSGRRVQLYTAHTNAAQSKSEIIKLNACTLFPIPCPPTMTGPEAQKVRERKIQFEILLHFPFCQFVHAVAAMTTTTTKAAALTERGRERETASVSERETGTTEYHIVKWK